MTKKMYFSGYKHVSDEIQIDAIVIEHIVHHENCVNWNEYRKNERIFSASILAFALDNSFNLFYWRLKRTYFFTLKPT